MRWVVGDVQGCAVELERLLETVRFDPERDELWSLGDLVNRGPDSLAALRLWRDVGGKGILGNHDLYALRAWDDPSRRKEDDTLGELFAAVEAAELLARLRELPVLVDLSGTESPAGDVWIVHAGLHPEWTDLPAAAKDLNDGPRDAKWFRRDSLRFAVGVRCCDARGRPCRHSGPPDECPEGFRPWDEFYRGDAMIVHGHWAMRGYYRNERTMGLDSGCVYGGELTAWCQEEDRIVRVPARGRTT